jgi:hypothetical protein
MRARPIVGGHGGYAWWMCMEVVHGGRVWRLCMEIGCRHHERRLSEGEARNGWAWWICAVDVRRGHAWRSCVKVVCGGCVQRSGAGVG